MKKFTTILLVICMAMALAACGNGGSKTNTPSASGNKVDVDTAVSIDTESAKAPEPTDEPQRFIRSEFTEIGEWKGVYFKTIMEDVGNIDDDFHLVLNENGTGTNYRDGKEYPVTWFLDGEDFKMTELDSEDGKILNGTMYAGVLHLFDGDIYDPNTIEYIYGKGDLSGIYIPGHDELYANTPFDYVRGDWYGVYNTRACIGDFKKYEGIEDMALARFVMKEDGSLDGFVGLGGEILQFEDVTITENAMGDEFYFNGSWGGMAFDGVTLFSDMGHITLDVYLSNDSDENAGLSAMHIVISLRRTTDITWSSTDVATPDDAIIEKVKAMSFEDLAAEIGYTPDMYPKTPPETVRPSAEDIPEDPVTITGTEIQEAVTP